MKTAGIDIGSITTKAAILVDGKIAGTRVAFTGYNAEQAGRDNFDALLRKLGVVRDELNAVISTGYGRNSVKFADKAMTEIICHGAGAHFLNPAIRSVIDIGGQDSKAIAIGENGKVKDFAMNDKCAAGTGRFLEVMARALELDLGKFGAMSLKAETPESISSICTVFAESEVISLISKGATRENIIAGIHDSVAARITALARRVGVTEPVMITGGVAKNIGLVRAMERKLGCSLEVTDSAQVNGAIGAAVMASRL